MARPSPLRGQAARTLAGVAALSALGLLGLLAAAGALGAATSGLLTLLPVLALAAVMLVRPYAGERVIAALRRDTAARPGPSRPFAARAHARRAVLGGGLLIAASLAGRAPPCARAVSPACA